jgi:hypothetical protein
MRQKIAANRKDGMLLNNQREIIFLKMFFDLNHEKMFPLSLCYNKPAVFSVGPKSMIHHSYKKY